MLRIEMKIWVVGDLHGCEETFKALIRQMELKKEDRLISIGDLINRGPRSAEVLDMFCKDRRFSAILGNHDWAFILSALAPSTTVHDDFKELASSPRSGIWISWLRNQPFAKVIGDCFLVHAGCWPGWSLQEHQNWADHLHQWFKKCSVDELKILESYLPTENSLGELSVNENPIRFYAFVMNVLTRIRYLNRKQPWKMEMQLKGAPFQQPRGLPWFDCAPPLEGRTIVFGHWSALRGLQRPGIEGLDTGCVWGESLSALELYSRKRITQKALESR
jgi:bis(5'-nucleosyl)-tetraphosphatase (symmetrical)